MAIPDIEREKEIARIPYGEGHDGDSFDPEMELIFCAGGNDILTMVQKSSTTHFEAADIAATRQGKRARGP